MEQYVLIFVAGLLAGAMNAAAGGGSFITFPALIYVGIPPLTANASSTVTLLPGSVAGAIEYRQYFKSFHGISVGWMMILTLAGGGAGAVLLLHTPAANFTMLVPWLLLTGTLAFAFGRRIGNHLKRFFLVQKGTVLSAQFLLGIYGGYFGGAVGIMMMAVWSAFGMTDIKMINANKNILVAMANLIAVFIFILVGKVAWPQTSVMLAAAVMGGFLGGRYTRDMDPVKLRLVISIFNVLITIAFFVRVYG